MAESDRGRRGFGIVALVAGVVAVVGAVVLWLYAGQRYDDAVAELAPAPIGCDTTLVFDRTGTYTLFLETKGSVAEIDGDCDYDDRSYDLGDDVALPVELTLLDAEGDEVDLDRTDGPTYRRAGAEGAGFRTVDIESEGDYVLSAAADDSDAMIRVGRDPSSGVTATRLGAMGLAVVGVGLVVAGLWRVLQRPAAAGPAVGGPADRWPQVGHRALPTAPPYANPPVPPPYGVPARPSPAPTPQTPRPPDRPPGGWPGSGRPLPPPSGPPQ